MSEKTLVQKICEVMQEVGYIQKDAVNEFQRYSYASAQAVYDKAREALASRGIVVSGDVEVVTSEIIKGDKLKHLVVLKHYLTFSDGKEQITVASMGSGIDTGDKAAMKANTAAIKYCLAKAFLISWGDDPEADPSTDQENPPVDRWQAACVAASHGTTAERFAAWWKEHGSQVKADCSEADAAQVYESYTTYLKRLKAEVADANN